MFASMLGRIAQSERDNNRHRADSAGAMVPMLD
jgi:hypothetical protein